MRTLVISGGGNRISAAAAKIRRIDEEFDCVVGISSGALLSAFAALGLHKVMEEITTNISWRDVLDERIVNKKGHFRPYIFIRALLTGRPSLTNSKALKKTISHYYHKYDIWTRLAAENKSVVVGVYNMSIDKIEYISSDDVQTLEEWINYVWASASFPPFLGIRDTPRGQLVDGGVKDHSSIAFAASFASSITAVIMQDPETKAKKDVQNFVHFVSRLFEGAYRELQNNDLEIGKRDCERYNVRCYLHRVRQGNHTNPLHFVPELMREWYLDAFSEELKPEAWQ